MAGEAEGESNDTTRTDKKKKVWGTFSSLIQQQTARFSESAVSSESTREAENTSASPQPSTENKALKIHTTSSLAKALYSLLEKNPALVEKDVKNALSVKRTLSREKTGQAERLARRQNRMAQANKWVGELIKETEAMLREAVKNNSPEYGRISRNLLRLRRMVGEFATLSQGVGSAQKEMNLVSDFEYVCKRAVRERQIAAANSGSESEPDLPSRNMSPLADDRAGGERASPQTAQQKKPQTSSTPAANNCGVTSSQSSCDVTELDAFAEPSDDVSMPQAIPSLVSMCHDRLSLMMRLTRNEHDPHCVHYQQQDASRSLGETRATNNNNRTVSLPKVRSEVNQDNYYTPHWCGATPRPKYKCDLCDDIERKLRVTIDNDDDDADESHTRMSHSVRSRLEQSEDEREVRMRSSVESRLRRSSGSSLMNVSSLCPQFRGVRYIRNWISSRFGPDGTYGVPLLMFFFVLMLLNFGMDFDCFFIYRILYGVCLNVRCLCGTW